MNTHIPRLVAIVALAMFIFTLLACKKDLGNYSYKELPGFYLDTVGQQTVYEVAYGIGNIRINPTLVYDGENELSYLWTIYQTVGSIATDKTPGIPDTLSTDLSLETPLTKPLGQYTLELRVTEENTGIKVFQRYTVDVVPPYAAGFMVCHELNGSFDVDFLRAPELNASYSDTLINNIYFNSNGNRLPGSPLGFLRMTARGGIPPSLYVISTEGGSLVESGTFAKIFDYEDFFFSEAIRPPSGSKPKGAFSASIAIGNTFYHPTLRYTPKLSSTSAAHQPDDRGYTISNVMLTGSGINFYDEKNNRLLIAAGGVNGVNITAYPKANSTARFSLDSLGSKELLYLKRGFNNGSGTVIYGFFKDKVDLDKRYLYLMDIGNTANPDKAALDISSSPFILQAVDYELVDNAPYAFYATATDVYRILLNISGNTYQTSDAGFKAPAGEVITKMSLYNNDLMFVATWNEGLKEGTLYLLAVGNGGVLGAPVKTWTGFDGKITWLESKTS